MESEYRIDQADNLVYKTHIGVITVDDEIALLEAILADKAYHSGMDALCDYSQATVDWNLADLDRIRGYISRIKQLTGPCKWALVPTGGVNNSTARIFVALHAAFEDTIEVKLFDTPEEALRWLRPQSGNQ